MRKPRTDDAMAAAVFAVLDHEDPTQSIVRLAALADCSVNLVMAWRERHGFLARYGGPRRRSGKSNMREVHRQQVFNELDRLDPDWRDERLAALSGCSVHLVRSWREQGAKVPTEAEPCS